MVEHHSVKVNPMEQLHNEPSEASYRAAWGGLQKPHQQFLLGKKQIMQT